MDILIRTLCDNNLTDTIVELAETADFDDYKHKVAETLGNYVVSNKVIEFLNSNSILHKYVISYMSNNNYDVDYVCAIINNDLVCAEYKRKIIAHIIKRSNFNKLLFNKLDATLLLPVSPTYIHEIALYKYIKYLLSRFTLNDVIKSNPTRLAVIIAIYPKYIINVIYSNDYIDEINTQINQMEISEEMLTVMFTLYKTSRLNVSNPNKMICDIDIYCITPTIGYTDNNDFTCMIKYIFGLTDTLPYVRSRYLLSIMATRMDKYGLYACINYEINDCTQATIVLNLLGKPITDIKLLPDMYQITNINKNVLDLLEQYIDIPYYIDYIKYIESIG